ncbi:hypothetical protein AMJ57_01790 [Parcubacteria bacterium SG8_24]|nr:MAG: hypothetical protein AMJ57_01790 [Parcubacteria bacterium SG8_24]
MPTTFVAIFIEYAVRVLPWFLIGVLAAYLVERRVSPRDVSRFLGSFRPRRILASFALGMVSPLSIMPQLPVSGSLVRLGAHPALLLGFLAAERSYDFQSFPIISGFFGLRFAVLNALAIYLALLAAILVLARTRVKFRAVNRREGTNGFWYRQVRLGAVVLIGLAVAATARTAIPEELFRGIAQTELGGLATALVAGFSLYFGTILGNYPVAKALADLGMSQTGIFTFLTVSPLFNAVVLTLFVSAAHWRQVFRFFTAYTMVALLLSVIIGTFLL